MKTAKANKPAGTSGASSGSASPKPGKSWSKVAAGGPSKKAAQGQLTEGDKGTSSTSSKLLDVVSGLLNTEVDVTTRTGTKYRGTVSLIDPAASEVAVVLRNASQIQDGSPNEPSTAQEVRIKLDDLVEVFSAKVNVANPAQSAVPGHSSSKSNAWKTDTDISGHGQVRERVLQAWQPSSDDTSFSIEEDSNALKPNSAGKKWDQFAANEKLFGVKSEWDEDMYTHKLDTTRPDFAKKQAEAEKLAREIEQSTSTNAHVSEERGFADDSGTTEEDKYSGVQRSSNAWIPPARRPVANLPAPRTTLPVDPAIISSQLAKPGSTSHRSTTSVASPSSVTNEGSNTSKNTNLIETDIMARFKQFATNERDRLSVKKAATFKKEKDGRLQDLLAFSKDFKLTTPVPEDLIPILAKDKAKQDAIIQKAVSTSASPSMESNAGNAGTRQSDNKLPETLRGRVDRAHRSPNILTSPTPVAKAQTPELKKLKPSAAEFKPFNPAASSFTPSTFSPRVAPSASPALSTTSSQPRQSGFSADATSFFPRKPTNPSERPSILDQYNPFKSYRTKNPDSPLDIETPLKVDPSWPGDEAQSITDAPPESSRRPSQFEDPYQSLPPQINHSPQMMYVGSPQQAQGMQQQAAYYSNKSPQFVPGLPGQFIPYQSGPGFVPPQYMYQGAQGYNPRMMGSHLPPVQYQVQQYGNYPQPVAMPMGSNGFSGHSQNSPRQRQNMSHGQQRSPELHKPTPRPPPMSTAPSKDT
ncbi:protein of unknown function [Taphrina deformans PYCC 5710]|uniref:LsmAD domain-containing protein n=1 Tax=Taphrina deformans (strain PYCC 5710 / ATCC 11124 / CBS 356.35 / IMI 108563 / JCM 9778 / NBRC 8474) TaxID=1097556 RepID=R4XGW9_TAPDE|nr:protein of unknown function [Taphrina deformans PYCC 5710]|eukprot:CCG84938.1 protein of unknown function [Taphrina deformans PYCC 5710]